MVSRLLLSVPSAQWSTIYLYQLMYFTLIFRRSPTINVLLGFAGCITGINDRPLPRRDWA